MSVLHYMFILKIFGYIQFITCCLNLLNHIVDTSAGELHVPECITSSVISTPVMKCLITKYKQLSVYKIWNFKSYGFKPLLNQSKLTWDKYRRFFSKINQDGNSMTLTKAVVIAWHQNKAILDTSAV